MRSQHWRAEEVYELGDQTGLQSETLSHINKTWSNLCAFVSVHVYVHMWVEASVSSSIALLVLEEPLATLAGH